MRVQPLAPPTILAVERRTLLTDHLALLLAVTASRWIFRSHDLYQMDSINYALGMQHFAPALHQPHPPGYYLYVKLGQLVQQALPNPNDALVAISILASGLTAALIYQLADAWFGRAAARWAGLLFVFSPLAWFHGTVALVYIVEAAMSALIGYLCWLAWRGRHTMAIPAAAAFGLAAGIRQSTALFLALLLMLALLKVGLRRALLALGAGALTVTTWLLPMLTESGGYSAYFTALNDLWTRVSPLSATHAPIVAVWHVLFMITAFGLCFGAAAPLLLVRGLPIQWPLKAKFFLAAWLIPGLLFFLGGVFPAMNLGYLLFLFIPLFVVLGAKIAVLPEIGERGKKRALLILGLVAVNTSIFLFVPLYVSHATVKQYEQELPQVVQGLRVAAHPENTIVVAFDAHFFGFRHLGYNLPEYLILSFPEHRFSRGFGVFAMQKRKTEILSSIPIRRYQHFALFIPPGADLIRNLLLARFPSGTLVSRNINGYEFLVGPASSLDKIFPVTARVNQHDRNQYHQPNDSLEPVGIQTPRSQQKQGNSVLP